MGYIYKITNTVNGSCYVGMTKGAIDKRLKKHISSIRSGGCSALSEAMLEYGTSNFIIESIAESSNLTELIGLESQYIRSLGTLHPNGYNLTTAGNDCKVSDITKSKISDAMTGRDVTWGDKVSQSVKELWKSSGYRKKQDESRKKIRGKYKPDIKRPPKVSITTEDVESMLNAGYTINQIAVHYGVAFSTIKKRTVK
tara:strand:+ start:1672 stop:2265 length:594 start_codon:yes stop_codon:yes gene_type:complete